MVGLGGRDRTAEEWAHVVQLASPDLEVGQFITSPGRLWSVIEIRKKA